MSPVLQMERMQDMSEEVWEGSGVVQMEPFSLDEAPTDLKYAPDKFAYPWSLVA